MPQTEKQTRSEIQPYRAPIPVNMPATVMVQIDKSKAPKSGKLRYKVKSRSGTHRRRVAARSKHMSSPTLSHYNHRALKPAETATVEISVPDLGMAARAKNLLKFFGNQTTLAEILHVHRGQPGRWATGQESPSIENQRRVIGMDHVVELASLIWTDSVARDWLKGSNSYLDGAKPIDVLAQEGPVRVIEALEAAMEGSYS
ncbi:uncharacterized protein (DUF2384 family) [Arthrobacter sp. CAN_A214]|uniref:DUF2384 domain-containing protein n=1 Tax=Arthrobacter sp. CAN_A214 TaxID=2787720 RepID=UPI0018C91B6D